MLHSEKMNDKSDELRRNFILGMDPAISYISNVVASRVTGFGDYSVQDGTASFRVRPAQAVDRNAAGDIYWRLNEVFGAESVQVFTEDADSENSVNIAFIVKGPADQLVQKAQTLIA